MTRAAEDWARVLRENMSADDEWNEWDLRVVADLIAAVQREAGAPGIAPDAPLHLAGDDAVAAGWCAPRPDCRRCGRVFERPASSKDGHPKYAHHRPECSACFEERVRAAKARP